MKKKWTKAALALSSCLFILWWALGTGATLAWFSDSDTVRNEFKVGLINLDVSYRNDIVQNYTPMDAMTTVFNDKALYEPGYTQVVYLQIENNGDVDFKYKMAVTVEDSDKGKNIWGEEIYLPNYLRYGVVFAESEAELNRKVGDRLTARDQAGSGWGSLGTWSEVSPYTFEAGEKPHYAALIVFMPENVGNEANYRGTEVPQVQLGISVFAQQANAPIK